MNNFSASALRGNCFSKKWCEDGHEPLKKGFKPQSVFSLIKRRGKFFCKAQSLPAHQLISLPVYLYALKIPFIFVVSVNRLPRNISDLRGRLSHMRTALKWYVRTDVSWSLLHRFGHGLESVLRTYDILA